VKSRHYIEKAVKKRHFVLLLCSFSQINKNICKPLINNTLLLAVSGRFADHSKRETGKSISRLIRRVTLTLTINRTINRLGARKTTSVLIKTRLSFYYKKLIKKLIKSWLLNLDQAAFKTPYLLSDHFTANQEAASTITVTITSKADVIGI